MEKEKIEKILNRKIYDCLLKKENLHIEAGARILITGADGSIGRALTNRLDSYENITVMTTDIVGDHTYLDVTDFQNTFSVINKFKPSIIVNIAGAKHAPLGEREIWKTLSINTIGTMNLIDASPSGCKLILTSTCKGNNPEVVYGASKLIAEKMTLSSGGSVARFFNVIETVGNVFEIWQKTPTSEPLKVAEECERHFISLEESVGLIIYTMNNKPGRYIVNSPDRRLMSDIANVLYPQREKSFMKPRTGDRLKELFKSSSEEIETTCFNDTILMLSNSHDKK